LLEVSQGLARACARDVRDGTGHRLAAPRRRPSHGLRHAIRELDGPTALEDGDRKADHAATAVHDLDRLLRRAEDQHQAEQKNDQPQQSPVRGRQGGESEQDPENPEENARDIEACTGATPAMFSMGKFERAVPTGISPSSVFGLTTYSRRLVNTISVCRWNAIVLYINRSPTSGVSPGASGAPPGRRSGWSAVCTALSSPCVPARPSD